MPKVFSIEQISTIYERRVPDRVKELSAKHIEQDSLKLITRISEDMRKRMQRILRKGEREGKSVSAIASRLLKTGLNKGVFKSAKSRSWMIARTELHRARQAAALDVYKANHIKKVRWIVIDDKRLCPKCEKRRNKVYYLSKLKTFRYSTPPRHPRCRCRLVPWNMEVDIKPKRGKGKGNKAPTPQNYRYVILAKALTKAAYPGNLGFSELYNFMNNAPPEAVKRYESFLSRGHAKAAVAELERFVGYKLHPSVWQRFRSGKYETVHRVLAKSKRVFVPQSVHHKAYYRKDPRIKHEGPTTPVQRIETFLDPERPDVRMAKRVANEVAAAGGRALFIGGCVRDALLGKVSKDVDIEVYGLTAEKLQEILSKLGKVDAVGRSFGVLKLSSPDLSQSLDVSIPRRDNKTGKGHKGFIVSPDPTMTIREAARRRDLTINAVAYDPMKKEIIDEFGGLKDLEDKKLRATDTITFVEDPLRVLRVMQFAARLGFVPDVQLVRLCRSMDLTELPKERVFDEVQKLLLQSKYPSIGLGLIPALGINKIMPEIDDLRGVPQDPQWHPEGNLWRHVLLVVDAAAKLRSKFKNDKDKIVLMLAALCHDLGKPATTEVKEGRITTYGHDDAGVEPTRQLLGRISHDTEIQTKVEELVREHMKPTFFYHDKVPDSAVRRLAKRVNIPLLAALSMSDKLGRGGPVPDLKAERWLLGKYKELKLDQPKALYPLVLGRHMIQMGMMPGPEMGKVVKQLYEAQLDGKFKTPEDGVAYAQEQGWLPAGKVYDVASLEKSQRVFVPQSYHHKAYYREDPRERQFPQNIAPPLINYTDIKDLGQVYLKEYVLAEVKDPQGDRIIFTEKNFLHITKLDTGTADRYRCERLFWIKDIIQNPDLIVKDKRDPEARLFLKWYNGEPYLFVCRVSGNQFHSVTAYPLESHGKIEALLRQEKVYTRPGALFKSMLPKSTKKEGESMDKNFAMVLDPERFKKKMAELRKSKLLGKKIPVRTERGLQFYKAVKGGLLVKGQGRTAKLGDKILIKGLPAQITAVGKDGITARDANAQKYQVFYKNVELIRSREELRK